MTTFGFDFIVFTVVESFREEREAYHKGERLFSNIFQYDDELFFCNVSVLPNKHNSGLPLWLSW